MTEVAYATSPSISPLPDFPKRAPRGGNPAQAEPRAANAVRKPTTLLWMLSLATFGSGLVNLYSLIGPALPERVRLLREIFPLEFLRLSRFFTLLIGFALIVSSINIYKRKRRAFQIVFLLACSSVIVHLTKGLDYEEALFSFALLLGLIFTRKQFTVRSSMPDLRGGLLRLALALGIGVSYGVAGLWLLDRREFGIDFSLHEAFHQTFSLLLLTGAPRLVPRTPYARWFLDSLYLMTMLAVGYACLAVFRPALYVLRTHPHERALAQQLVKKYGRSSLDYFKTWPDKSFFFAPSSQCFLAYGVAANFALVLGDPVGPEEEMEPTVRAFMDLCAENDWGLGYYQTRPDFLPIYKRLGFRKLKIGDDAIVDLPRFTLGGKAMKELRSKASVLEKQGVRAVFHAPPISEEVLSQAKAVSDEWLGLSGRRERRFSLGMFEPHYVRTTPLFAAVDGEGRWLAFTNLIPSGVAGEATVDLMRRRTEAPNGIMDYLFVKLFLHLKAEGFQRFNFGMAPMSGFQEREEASREERAVHFFFQHLNFLFHYRGLRRYKAKFATVWEPRYAIYRNPLDLPRLAIALRQLSEIKGD